jgi:hypothetical protein
VSVTHPSRTVIWIRSGGIAPDRGAFRRDDELVGDRAHAPDVPGGLLRDPFFPQRPDPSGQRDDALLDGDADLRSVDAGLPVERLHDALLQFIVGSHGVLLGASCSLKPHSRGGVVETTARIGVR